MGCRETRHVRQGIEQQGVQCVAIAGLEQIFKILLDEGWRRPGVSSIRQSTWGVNAGAVPEGRFKIVRRERIREQLWEVATVLSGAAEGHLGVPLTGVEDHQHFAHDRHERHLLALPLAFRPA